MIDWREEEAGSDGEIRIFKLDGELDSETCDFLYSVLEGRIEDGNRKLILDCERLQIISSMGLGMLMRVHAKIKKNGGDVKLARIHGAIAELLKLVMLDRVLHLYPSVQAAIESYSA